MVSPVGSPVHSPVPTPASAPAPSPAPTPTPTPSSSNPNGNQNNGDNGANQNQQPYQRQYIPGFDNRNTQAQNTGSQAAGDVQNNNGGQSTGASGEVRSVNGQIVDANGNPTVLKGYNVWNPQSATLDDPNLNTVRFNQQDWEGANRDQNAFLTSVQQYAEANPGKTIILGHRGENMAGGENKDRLLTPEKVEDGVQFWEQASTMFKDNPNVIFNLENEIGFEGEDNAEVFGYYEKLIPAARSGGATNPLLIGDNGFGQGSVTQGTSIEDDFLVEYGSKLRELDPQDNIIGSIHPYNPESYDKLTKVVGAIKESSGLPVIADEFGDHQNPNAPEWVQRAAQEGVLDGLLFWGGPDLTGPEDVANFNNNWEQYLASLPGIVPGA